MEPVIRGVVPTIIESIIPVENIPLQELPEYYTALAVKAKDIYNLWEQALQNSAVVENAFEDNVQGDEDFAETFEGALNVAAREIELLKEENIHLKNQKIEITKAADENAKSAQERISELEKVIALQNKDNKILKKTIAIQGKAIETFETVCQQVASFPCSHGSDFAPSFMEPRWGILQNQVRETQKQLIAQLKSLETK
ncbi:MAG: hypothetical protein H0W50_06415 [Parachlamydiaceae bacterium]|nr:hypothetical protein [Parachlamydiaceae bacterium]